MGLVPELSTQVQRSSQLPPKFPNEEGVLMEMRPLSADAQARMTEMVKEVLEPAMKQQAQRNPEDFVYTAPEVWMQQVMDVGARVVNRAITIAYKDWGLDELEGASETEAGKHVRGS